MTSISVSLFPWALMLIAFILAMNGHETVAIAAVASGSLFGGAQLIAAVKGRSKGGGETS